MKKLYISIIAFLALAVSITATAQETPKSSQKSESSIGLGMGLPYGAFGLRFSSNISNHFALFGGIGYQIVGVGYNVGVFKDFKTNSASQFYLTAMYGTNAAIKVQGLSEYDESYTGATIGLGLKINSRKKEGNFWDVGLMVPFTASAYKDAVDQVRNDPRIGEFTEAWPVLIVVGYNFNL